ncbi:MAG: 50S ribosomal protein L11 methyltransferase [Candidatus Sumerlaeota bacterium]|nr:50S ribosomal protein L11 methyltransferase [Candidatus Sumerlaeota bacterium]
MPWISVEIAFSPDWTEENLEQVSARLALADQLGWMEEISPQGNPVWKVFFPEDAANPMAVMRAILCATGGVESDLTQEKAFSLKMERVADTDWMAGFRAYFQPQAVSQRFAVAPPWFQAPWPFPGRERITIYPAMAFGTGTHATTQLAIRALEECGCEGKTVLDAGTGSGILAIAALWLGARRVVGFDVDAIALANARENCVHNGLEGRIEFFCGGPGVLRGACFDIIVANILYANLRPLLPDLKKLLSPGPQSQLILGGFLQSESAEVARDLAALGLKPVSWSQQDEWAGVIAMSHSQSL